MDETFYSVLGVRIDADRETIRRAYRDHVKETHPDVSDNPDAGVRFKRITTARNVLLDVDERACYDRLGHDEYVREHVTDSAWQTGTVTNTETERGSPWRQYATSYRRPGWDAGRDQDDGRTDTVSGGETEHRHGDGVRDWTANGRGQATGEKASRTRSEWSGTHTEGHSRTDGGYATESWQTASQAYRRTPSVDDATPSSSPSGPLSAVRELGPWLVVHVVLVASALATAWFSVTAGVQTQSVTTVLFGLVLVTVVITLSLLHVMVRVYT